MSLYAKPPGDPKFMVVDWHWIDGERRRVLRYRSAGWRVGYTSSELVLVGTVATDEHRGELGTGIARIFLSQVDEMWELDLSTCQMEPW